MHEQKIKIEKEYIKVSWFLMGFIVLFLLLKGLFFNMLGENAFKIQVMEWIVALIFLIISVIYNIFKSWLLNSKMEISEDIYKYLKLFEIINLLFFFGYEKMFMIMFIVSLIFLLYLEKTNAKYSKLIVGILIFAHLFFIFKDFITNSINIETIYFLFNIIFYLFWLYIFKNNSIVENNKVENLANKSDENFDKKIEEAYQTINTKELRIKELEKEVNYLKEVNRRLNISLGEFFNLQEISKIITQILDTNELLHFVNDVLIGVTGVDKSSILLFNKEKTELYVAYSNISDIDQKESFKQENMKWLKRIALNGENGYKNKVNLDECPFIYNRPTKAIMYASLSTKNDKYGIILLEHIFEDIFSEDNLRFLTSIAAQVSIALENSSLYQQMRSMAMVDGLTGAYNRIYLYEVLEREIENSNKRYPISIALFDVDNFKKLNDTYGHLFGDKVLQTIVRIAKEKVRKEDIVARYGGEEFVIIFNHLEASDAFKVVERIRRAIENEIIEDSLVQTRVTVSFGISSYPYHAGNIKDLIKCADIAMYRAKSSGKNCTVIYNKELEMRV